MRFFFPHHLLVNPFCCLAGALRSDVEKYKATVLTRTSIGALIAFHDAQNLNVFELSDWKHRAPRHSPSPFPSAELLQLKIAHPHAFFAKRNSSDTLPGSLGPPIKDALTTLEEKGLLEDSRELAAMTQG